MPTITAFWNKLNANEKLVGYGIIVILVSWLVGLVTGGGFGSSWAFVAAVAVAIIYWLKYAPNQSITWPAPIQTIVLVIAGIAALLSILGLLGLLSFLTFLGIGYLIAVLGNAVGAGLMAYGAWMEYQAMPKTAAPAAPTSQAPPPSSPPPAAPPPSSPPPSSPPPPAGSV
jgi:hypothetical protein